MRHYLLPVLLLAVTVLEASAQRYLEEPARIEGEGPYVTSYTTLDGKYMRSYSYRYDSERHVSLWVAYPLNSALIGSGSRGEGWQPDPSISESVQPVLYKGFRYGSGYDRGHQIPSADRLDPEANRQTFLFTNATPQLHDFNGGIWAELEKVVRTWAKRSDTLYVVTGIIPGESVINDNAGKSVNIPAAYYKTILRRHTDKKGTVRWSACAILLPHENLQVGTWQQNLSFFREHSLSLVELEKLTGERYYPLLATILDEVSEKRIREASPSETTWWWR